MPRTEVHQHRAASRKLLLIGLGLLGGAGLLGATLVIPANLDDVFLLKFAAGFVGLALFLFGIYFVQQSMTRRHMAVDAADPLAPSDDAIVVTGTSERQSMSFVFERDAVVVSGERYAFTGKVPRRRIDYRDVVGFDFEVKPRMWWALLASAKILTGVVFAVAGNFVALIAVALVLVVVVLPRLETHCVFVLKTQDETLRIDGDDEMKEPGRNALELLQQRVRSAGSAADAVAPYGHRG